jgi:hypothetical protein
MVQNIKTNDERKLLYTYWHDLPFLKKVDPSSLFHLQRSDVKNFILKYLRDGKEDEYGRKSGLARRHAFSVKELHIAFTSLYNEKKYSESNFHFHIKNLIEEGYVKIISTILENRHKVTYYGRTAVIFDMPYNASSRDHYDKTIFNPMKDVLKAMNPNLDSKKIDQLVNNNQKFIEDYFNRLYSWLKEKYHNFYDSNLDLMSFMLIALQFSMYHKELSFNAKTISDLLSLDKIETYEPYQAEQEKKNE